MQKSVKKFYEQDRSYDYEELSHKIAKKRSHKRLRQQLKPTEKDTMEPLDNECNQ